MAGLLCSGNPKIGITTVLHTWGSALTHHPHVHMIVPGGGIARDGKRWVSCRPGFFLPVRVLSRLFRRLFLERLTAAHKQFQFFGNHTPLADAQAFAAYLAPLRKTEWVVYSKPPFGGPEAVLAYPSRYTHRVAIANSRLIAFDEDSVTFKWKDYRIEGRDRYKQMTLATDEFIRRFLIHVLPKRFHRIRHYGLLANTSGADNIARARELLAAPKPQSEPADADATDHNEPACPCCGGRMIIIETFSPPSLSAVSSLGGFRTPAFGACRTVRQRPASENLHRSGHVWCKMPCPPWAHKPTPLAQTKPRREAGVQLKKGL
jgi:hypothetical protein